MFLPVAFWDNDLSIGPAKFRSDQAETCPVGPPSCIWASARVLLPFSLTFSVQFPLSFDATDRCRWTHGPRGTDTQSRDPLLILWPTDRGSIGLLCQLAARHWSSINQTQLLLNQLTGWNNQNWGSMYHQALDYYYYYYFIFLYQKSQKEQWKC